MSEPFVQPYRLRREVNIHFIRPVSIIYYQGYLRVYIRYTSKIVKGAKPRIILVRAEHLRGIVAGFRLDF